MLYKPWSTEDCSQCGKEFQITRTQTRQIDTPICHSCSDFNRGVKYTTEKNKPCLLDDMFEDCLVNLIEEYKRVKDPGGNTYKEIGINNSYTLSKAILNISEAYCKIKNNKEDNNKCMTE